MATNSTTRPATARPPKGLSYELRSERPAPFFARWREAGKRVTRAFTTEQDRAAFALTWAEARRQSGRSVAIAAPATVATWKEFARITNNADPLEVARHWAKSHAPLELSEAVRRYSVAQAGRKLSRDTETHRELHLARLVAALGASTPVGDVRPDDVRRWLDALKLEGKPASAASQRHHRANARKLWRWLQNERLSVHNPIDAVPIPEDHDDAITLLTVAQARKVFEVNAGHLSIGRLALEAFAGLRFSSAARLTRDDLKPEEKGIVLPGPKHKTGRRHFIDGLPDNVWAWVAHAPEACWQVSPRNYFDHKRTMLERAGLKGQGIDDEASRNALRHSFASYHVAAYRNAGKTAVILTHRTPSMLYQHYKGRATEADGLAYFGILPPVKS